MQKTMLALALICTLVGPVRGQATGGCEPRTSTAVVQTLGVNFVVNRADLWVLGEEWADVGFESWGRNLRLGWEWDENNFDVNMVLHPYHGSLYFAAARANCLNFWRAIPMTVLGSWTWEYFGETWRPSMNDFFMTSFGGIALGESLHRISTSLLDEAADGNERVAREVAVLVLNPMRGLNRLLRGDWTRRGRNPKNRIPDSYLVEVGLGARRVQDPGSRNPRVFPALMIDVSFGDPLQSEYRAPFDAFSLEAQLSPDGRGLNIVRSVGRLYRNTLGPVDDAHHRHQLTVNQRFDYVSNPAYQFGEQSIEIGLMSRWRLGDSGVALRSFVAADGVLLGAIDVPGSGFGERSNDFGPGGGLLAEVRLERDGRPFLSAYTRYRYLHSVSGAPANHQMLFTGADLWVPVTDRLGLKINLSSDHRRSRFDDQPTDRRSYYETRVFATWTPAFQSGEDAR